jgi:TP901 family phage tail tape measure protein
MGGKFDEVLRLIIEAGGGPDVELLAKQLEALSVVSAEGSKETLALVEKLKALAATAQQVQGFTRLKGELTETGAAVALESEKLVQLKAELTSAEKPTAGMTRAFDKSQKALQALLTTQNRQSVELQKTASVLTKAGIDTDHLANASRKLGGDIDSATKKLKSASTATADTTTKMGKLEHTSLSTAEQLKDFALRLGAVALAAEGVHKVLEFGEDFVSEALKHAEDLEAALAQAGAVTGATADQMERLKAAAEDAAQTTSFNALEAAQALTELGRASGSAEDAIKELPSTLNLAKAAGTDVATAATLMVQTLAEFGLKATEAARVSDLLAKGAKSGGLELSGLSEELARTAPLAKAAGLSIEQTVSIMGALAKEGVRGRLAAGGLKDAFAQLSDPFSAFSSRLDLMGIKTRDFSQIMIELSKRSDKGREAILALSANARPAIELLVADGGAKIRELSVDLTNAAGSAKQAADDMDNTLAGAFNAIGKTYEELQVALLTPILKPLQEALRGLSKQIDAFAKSPDFAEISEALKQTFVEGAKAAEELFHAIDFHALAKQLKDFAGDAKSSITQFRESLGGIITTIQVVYQAFKFTFHAIETVVLLTAAAVAKTVSVLAELAAKLQELRDSTPIGIAEKKLGINKDTAKQLHEFAGGMDAVATAYKLHLGDAIDATVADFDNFKKAATAGGEAAAAVVPKIAAVGQATDEASARIHLMATQARLTGDAYHRLAGSADKVTAAQKKTTESTLNLDKAFEELGITTQAKLEEKAKSTKEAYESLFHAFQAGQTPIDNIRRAFVAMAEAQRASVADGTALQKAQKEGELALQASAIGVTESLKTMGEAGAEAGTEIAHGAAHAASALRDTKNASDDAAESINHLSTAADFARTGLKEMSFSLGSMSEEAAKAYASVNRFIVNVEPSVAALHQFAQAFNRVTQELVGQQTELKKLDAALDAHLAKLDPLADKIAKLKSKFGFVDPSALRAIAEKQQRVEDEDKRAAEEAKRALEEQQRAIAEKLAHAAEARKREQEDAARSADDVKRRDEVAGAGADATSAPRQDKTASDGNVTGAKVSKHELTLKFDAPTLQALSHFSHDQIDHLIDQMMERIRQQLEVMLRP